MKEKQNGEGWAVLGLTLHEQEKLIVLFSLSSGDRRSSADIKKVQL